MWCNWIQPRIQGEQAEMEKTITYQGSLKELKFSNPKEERTEVFKHIKRHNHCFLSVMEERRGGKKRKKA